MGTIPLFDCDNHIYEPPDAVTRFLPDEYLNRAITPVTLANGEEGLLAGGRLVTGLDHPIDMAHRPGALKTMLREMKSGKPTDSYALEPLRPEYLEREPRLRPHGPPRDRERHLSIRRPWAPWPSTMFEESGRFMRTSTRTTGG